MLESFRRPEDTHATAQRRVELHRRGFLAGAGAVVLAGCSSEPEAAPAPPPAPAPETPPPPRVTVSSGAPAGAALRVRPTLTAAVADGTLVGVAVRPLPPEGEAAQQGDPEVEEPVQGAPALGGEEVAGALGPDGAWTPERHLELATTYEAVATARNDEGAEATGRLTFTTVGEDGAVRTRMQPLPGERVGVGMPVVLRLTRPIAREQRQALVDAAVVERPEGIEGAWRWFSATEAHWRPRDYWPAGTTVRVVLPLTGVDVGGGVFGAEDRDFTFTVGDAHTSVVDADAHRMTVSVNGEVARTFPVSCGREDDDPSFVTRSGVHLVLEKHADFVMDGATVGQDYETPVKWATRISNSGEFVHGAPWSVGDQGVRNVSHGCVNASDADARWFHDLALHGDPVEVVGTDRSMELTNGLGDWTVPWESWASA